MSNAQNDWDDDLTEKEATQEVYTGFGNQIPPGAERIPGRGLVRKIVKTINEGTPDERKVTSYKPVSLDQDEARKKRMDFYHPDFGWLIDGFKHTVDRTPQDIMSDSSMAVAKAPD